MNIWFDIAHIPQYNFYRWIICRLASEGHTVLVTVLDRGKLARIAQKEIGGVDNIQLFILGKHKSTKLSAIVDANLIRNIQLLRWSRGRQIDLGFSNGYQLALIGKIRNFPSYSFDDDPETIDYRPKLWFNKETNYCIYNYDKQLSPKAHILPALKEWAYLAPGYFNPDPSVLNDYGLEPKSYIFAREVSVGTVNYNGQAYGAIREVSDLFPKDYKVLLSLERKDTVNQYPSDWILLREPLKDIHSLIFYSAGLVSSGDSMAREAALLGVPSFYLGIRYDMPANKAAKELAGMQDRSSCEFTDWICSIISGSSGQKAERQSHIRTEMVKKMTDVNKYMLDIVHSLQ